MTPLRFISVAAGLVLIAGCAGPSETGSNLTGAERREFADAMTQTDPLVTGEIPPADSGFRR